MLQKQSHCLALAEKTSEEYVLDPEAQNPVDLIWREYYNPVSKWLAVWKKIISMSFSPLSFFLSAMLDC